MSSPSHQIKKQFEQILKDTKILCELEPFVKKWSLEETLHDLTDYNFGDDGEPKIDSISQILQSIPDDKDAESGEKILRQIKALLPTRPEMKSLKCGTDEPCTTLALPQSHNSSEDDQHDQELQRTLRILQKIELAEAVSPVDIEEYKRGLGGKPDGPELNKTTMREWKNIFMEHWFHLSEPLQRQKEILIKRMIQKESSNKLKSSVSNSNGTSLTKRTGDEKACSFSGENQEASQFMSKRGNKNIALPSTTIKGVPKLGLQSHSTSTLPNIRQVGSSKPAQKQSAMLTLGGGKKCETLHLEKGKKSANSANNKMMAVPAENKKLRVNGSSSQGQGAENIHYVGQQGSASKNKTVNKINSDGRTSFKNSTAVKANIEIQRLKEKVWKTAVRPSSAMLLLSAKQGVNPSRLNDMGRRK